MAATSISDHAEFPEIPEEIGEVAGETVATTPMLTSADLTVTVSPALERRQTAFTDRLQLLFKANICSQHGNSSDLSVQKPVQLVIVSNLKDSIVSNLHFQSPKTQYRHDGDFIYYPE
jgi:hypothetical protein